MSDKSRPSISGADLGKAQSDLEDYTLNLRLAQAAKLKVDQSYAEAKKNHEAAYVALNLAIQAVKEAGNVPNPYAS